MYSCNARLYPNGFYLLLRSNWEVVEFKFARKNRIRRLEFLRINRITFRVFIYLKVPSGAEINNLFSPGDFEWNVDSSSIVSELFELGRTSAFVSRKLFTFRSPLKLFFWGSLFEDGMLRKYGKVFVDPIYLQDTLSPIYVPIFILPKVSSVQSPNK